MAFPTVASITATTSGGTSSSWNVDMPASVTAGELLLVFSANNSGRSITTPSGWTSIGSDTVNAGTYRGAIFAKIADGSEGGGTVTFSFSGSCLAAFQCFQIQGWSGSLSDVQIAASFVTGQTTSINGPSVTASWGSADNLFIDFGALGTNASITPGGSVSVTNYTSGTLSTSNGGSNRQHVYTWQRQLTSATDDPPGSGTLGGGNYNIVANTVVIRPLTVQNVTLTGVSSAEAEGTPAIQATVSPGGVASAEAAGTPAIQSNIALSGVSSAETHGSTTVSPQPMSITLSSVASAEAVGDPTAIQVQLVQLTAVDTAEAHGSTTVAPQSVNITLTGLSSAEAVGSAAVASQLNLTGISSAEAVGTITLQAYLALTGVASAEAHGTTLIEVTISFTGVASAAAFGSLTVNQIQTVTLTGVGSAEAIGSLLLRAVLSLTGIGTGFAAGTLSATRTVSFSGVGSLEAVGALSITAGAVTITLAGVPSSEAVGLLSALKAVVSGKELPPGLSFQVTLIPGSSALEWQLATGGSVTQQLPPGGS